MLLREHWLASATALERSEFAFMVREHVSEFYPGTESNYGLTIFDSHLRSVGEAELAPRRVWSLRCEGETGYLVASARTDGSLKLGPIVLPTALRRDGLMLSAVTQLQASYAGVGVPYLYATYPERNVAVRELARAAGWRIAGHVRGLYRDDAEVLIFKDLDPASEIRISSRGSHPTGESRIWISRKRGGSIRLHTSGPTAASALASAAKTLAVEVRAAGRVCFALVSSDKARELDADQVLDLARGKSMVVWR